MDRFRIVGPSRLRGRVRASGAKNAALPALAACLLTDQAVTLRRVPKVRDIATMRRLLRHCGVESGDAGAGPDDGLVLGWRGDHGSPVDAPYELVKTMRAGVLVLGPLLARRGEARVSLPGGCAIGVRPIDQHLLGLEALGAEITLDHGYVQARGPAGGGRLRGARFRFAQPTVTGTENLLMAATLAQGTTVLENCAREPEVANLAALLVAMGASIDGVGGATLTIEGAERLGGATHEVIGDRIEGGTYLLGAAVTAGDVTLEGIEPGSLDGLLEVLERAGVEVARDERGTIRVHGGEPRAVSVETAPFPGFPTDLQAQLLVLCTQARGASEVHETIFENRFQHAAELVRMGADIRVEGARARVSGPTPLGGATVMATDLRASACLVLAGLAATGETTIDRIYHLDRGYERMEAKLAALGARVERVTDAAEPST
jgi:UDP-N-acetylglucosamine 1-carboxyvinyltransferase